MSSTPIYDRMMREQNWRHATRTTPTTSKGLDVLIPPQLPLPRRGGTIRLHMKGITSHDEDHRG